MPNPGERTRAARALAPVPSAGVLADLGPRALSVRPISRETRRLLLAAVRGARHALVRRLPLLRDAQARRAATANADAALDPSSPRAARFRRDRTGAFRH